MEGLPKHTDINLEVDTVAELAFVRLGRPPSPESLDAFDRLTPDAFGVAVVRDAFEALVASLDEDGRPDVDDAVARLKGDALDFFAASIIGNSASHARLPRLVGKLLLLQRRRELAESHRLAGERLDKGDVAGFHAELHGLDDGDEGGILAELPFDEPTPDPVLWKDPGDRKDFCDPLLAVGDVAVLSGPGKAGKSTVVLALVHAMGTDADHGSACGLRVMPGRCILLGYEDKPVRVAGRALWYGGREGWAHTRHVRAPQPLWAQDPDDTRNSASTPFWRVFWHAAKAFDPTLVVIDPASVTFAGASNDAAQVRAFIAAVQAEAERLACGVLIVAHDTKAARHETANEGGPGVGAVQGSSQWTDGTRGLLHLARLPKAARDIYPPKSAILRCVHSNYGPSDWAAILEPQTATDGRWRGIAPTAVELVDDVESWVGGLKEAAGDVKSKTDRKRRIANEIATEIEEFCMQIEPGTYQSGELYKMFLAGRSSLHECTTTRWGREAGKHLARDGTRLTKTSP